MKCTDPQTTSQSPRVANASAPVLRVAPDAARTATGVMQAMLFAEILKPLTHALGPIGDSVTGSLAQGLFVRSQP